MSAQGGRADRTARFRAGERSAELARGYLRVAQPLVQRKRATEALPLLDTARRATGPGGDTLLLTAEIELERSYAYNYVPLQEEAYRAAERALRLLEYRRDRGQPVPDELLMVAYAQKASASGERDPNAALLYLRRADELARPDMPLSALRSLDLAGTIIYNRLGDYAAGIGWQQRIRERYRRLGIVRGEAVALANLAMFYSDAGRQDMAERTYAEAADWMEGLRRADPASGLEVNLAALYYNWARLDLGRGRLDRVGDHLGRLEYFINEVFGGHGNSYLSSLYAQSAYGMAEAGRIREADSLLLLARATIVAEDHPRYGPAELPRLDERLLNDNNYLQLQLNRQRIELLRPGGGSTDRVLAIARQLDTLALHTRSRMRLRRSLGHYRAETTDYTDVMTATALLEYRRSGDPAVLDAAYSRIAARKGILQRELVSNPRLAEGMGVPESVTATQRRLSLQLAQLEAEGGRGNPATAAQLIELTTRAERLRDSIATALPRYYRAGLADLEIAWRSTPVDNRPLVLEYYLTVDSIYCFRVAGGRELDFFVRPRPDSLGDLVRRAVADPPVARQLYDLLVAPGLAGQPTAVPLTLIPDGILWQLPFAALRNAAGRFLVEDHPVGYAYSWASLGPGAAPTGARRPYVGYGLSYSAPTGSPGRLSATLHEINDGRAIFGGRGVVERSATRERVLREDSAVAVLHLALHGRPDPDPFAAGLWLSDGAAGYELLTMADVLQAQFPAEVTILSACHSGFGPLERGDGPQSLARAFTFVGSQSVLASNWEANDEISRRIVGEFNRKLRDGLEKDVALQQATLAFLADATVLERDPRNWANFSLTGDRRPLTQPSWGRSPWLIGGLAGAVLLLLLLLGVRRR